MIILNLNFKMGVSFLVPMISRFFQKQIKKTFCLEAEVLNKLVQIYIKFWFCSNFFSFLNKRILKKFECIYVSLMGFL